MKERGRKTQRTEKVLSTSVADAFAFIGKPHTKETERFARTFDKFFDLFNVRSLTEGIRKRSLIFVHTEMMSSLWTG